MKTTFFIAFAMVAGSAFAGQKQRTVDLFNDTGCASIAAQEKRLQLMSAVMQPQSKASKDSAIQEIIAISNNPSLCTKDITGTYPVLETQENYFRVQVGKSKLWVMR